MEREFRDAAGYGHERIASGMRIVTERLVVRPLQDSDVPDLLEYLSAGDPMIERVMGLTPSREAIVKYWQPMHSINPYEDDPEWLSLLIELASEEKVVGNIGFGIRAIDSQHKHGSIGWALSPFYRGRGIATEAATSMLDFLFRVRRLHRVQARTGRGNAPSWRLMERLGMRREAHFRGSHTDLDGMWADEFVYAILRCEWATRGREA